MEPFSERLGRKRGTFADGIAISLPVLGLWPFRAARLLTTNVPKPLIVTRLPFFSDSNTAPTKAFIAFSAEDFEEPAALAICTTSSAFVMGPMSYARDGDGVNDAMERTASRNALAANGFSSTGTLASFRKRQAAGLAVSPVMNRNRRASDGSWWIALR